MSLNENLKQYTWTEILLKETEPPSDDLLLVIILLNKHMADSFTEEVLKKHLPKFSFIPHLQTGRFMFVLKFTDTEKLVLSSYLTRDNYPLLELLYQKPHLSITAGYRDVANNRYYYDPMQAVVLPLVQP